MALYQAKAAGKNRYEVFQPEMETALAPQPRARARPALGAGQRPVPSRLPADLQPRRPHARRRRGAAALGAPDARRHPARRVHPAARVKRPDPRGRPLGARARPVGRWPPGTPAAARSAISVNVSGRQLDDDAIVDDVRDALAISGLDPAALIDRDHRDRPDAQRRRDRSPAHGDQGSSASASPSTTSAPATRRSPISSSSRSTRSRSTAPSPTRITRSPESDALDPNARPTRQGPRPQDARRRRRNDRSARPPPRRARQRSPGLPPQPGPSSRTRSRS